MRWNDVGDSLCPVAQTAALIGDRWTLLILREALLGVRTFDGFERALGVSPHLLSTRLKRLVAEDILRREGDGRYRLTAAGLALQPVVLAIAAWGNRWRGVQDDPQTMFVHTDCGHAFEPQLTCSACREAVTPHAVETQFAQGLRSERALRR